MPDLDPGTQMVLLFFVLLFLRVPVAFALGLSSLYAMWAIGFGLDLVGDLLASGISKFSLLAIPFFILAGTLMGTVGIAERMIRFFRVLVGSLPGGMGIVGTVVCLFWGAVSGSGPASVAAIGPLIIKGMAEDGYPRPFAAALVCTGAALSIVIPPSIGLVIYGVIAETSIAELFIAAIVPGMVMGALMLLTLPFADRARTAARSGAGLASLVPPPYADRPYGERLARSFVDAFWGLLTPVVILGGIYAGVFTPTEAAIVATVYALLVGLFVYRTLTWRTLYAALVEASSSSAVVMLVVAFASLFGWVVTVDDLVGKYSSVLLGLSDNQWVILFVIMAVVLVAGMFMDAITIMFITLPIFLPVVRELGWDPVWFGVLLMVNLAIGLFTPPVGINLFVAANITRLSLEKIALGAIPFLLTSLVGLALVAAFPGLSRILTAFMG
ncbi:MAG: TRAP transporter large permease [Aurantimonas coralicida]|jgi:C4-dicarboxylate transporter, DctM subunit|uniref:TRAP transporter large permease protein n=2 Tax=Hyphomicrobiales TaxID=356 RepID=A0A0P0YZL5_9HYPH|nr:TRAP transporter large permease [Aurantimonas coralicida]ADI22767.1 TRAP-type C4-dicarboxylate transport system, large permease component [uncultured Rhizobium sp. HF0500_29J11]BAT26764.1 C4-dicarboxylate transport system permease large protein [Aurantimonas coralicida]